MAEPAAALHAVLGADIGPFEKKMREANQIAEQRAREMVTQFERTGKASERFGSAGAVAIERPSGALLKMGDRLKGIPGSISATTAAFDLMGSKASPVVGKLGGALSSLLSGGFTPLGLALGAVTAGIGLFATAQKQASDDAEKLNEKLKAQKDRFFDLVDAADKAARDRRRGRSATDLDTADDTVREKQDAVDIQRIRLRAAEEQRAAGLVIREREALKKAEDELYLAQQERFEIGRRIREQELGNRTEYDPAFEAKRNAEVLGLLREVREERENAERAAAELTTTMAGRLDLFESGTPAEGVIDPDNAATARAAREAAEAYAFEIGQALAGQQARDELMAGAEALWGDGSGIESAEVAGEKAAETFSAAFTKTVESADPFTDLERRMGFQTAAEQTESTLADFGSGFSSAFADFATGAESASEAFSEFAASFARDVGSMIAQQAALGAVKVGFQALGLPGFATGGSFSVGGAGGTDSQLVAFRATPGERVDITPPGRGKNAERSPVSVSVQIHNNAPGVSATARHSEGPGGPKIDVLIAQTVASDLERGGPISRTLGRTHGVRRRGRQG